jgi:hypothetical protein
MEAEVWHLFIVVERWWRGEEVVAARYWPVVKE